jgi:hypothetical protein
MSVLEASAICSTSCQWRRQGREAFLAVGLAVPANWARSPPWNVLVFLALAYMPNGSSRPSLLLIVVLVGLANVVLLTLLMLAMGG